MKFSYNLFVQRKNFDIQSYFKNNPTASYEEFSKFLVNKLIHPPDEGFFLNEKSKFIDKNLSDSHKTIVKKPRKKRITKNKVFLEDKNDEIK